MTTHQGPLVRRTRGSKPLTQRGRRRRRPVAVLVAFGILLTTILAVGTPLPAEAATVCGNSSQKNSTYRAFGIRLYRHEAIARGCRDGRQVTSAAARTNRMIKIGIAFIDYTNTSDRSGRDFVVISGEGGTSGSIGKGYASVNWSYTKKHDHEFDFYTSNGRLWYRYNNSSWY